MEAVLETRAEKSAVQRWYVLIVMCLVGMFWAIICPILVRVRGPIEIRDTIWATLDLETTS